MLIVDMPHDVRCDMMFLLGASIHHHTMMSLVVRLKKTLLILLEYYFVLILCLGCPGLRWLFSETDLLQKFLLFHVRLGR